MHAEIVFINDGSTDNTLAVLEHLRKMDSRIGILNLSRNFGKEVALTAGIDHAKGDAVIVIDADLQDPPEMIPEMLKHWADGFDVVYAKRTSRDGESQLKKRNWLCLLPCDPDGQARVDPRRHRGLPFAKSSCR